MADGGDSAFGGVCSVPRGRTAGGSTEGSHKSSGAGQRPRRRRSRQIGANGVKEKDINLAIARLLKKKLEKQGILVVMTREGEDDLSDPGAVNAKVQDLQRRVQLIHKKSRTV